MKRFDLTIFKFASSLFCTLVFASVSAAQSRDQNFPTPVTTTEINGSIKARDIGDSRLTSYYYAFDGSQGDIFINVVTKNFSGDIDVFAQEALRPLTKMVIYADSGVSETGRLVYLRKGERLLLRIEGRTPNDDPASFRIKFAGSFTALAGQKGDEAPAIESSTESEEARVKVNSVGTIIDVIPKPKPVKKEVETAKSNVPVDDIKEAKTEPKVAVGELPPDEKTVEKTNDDSTVFENKSAKVTVKPVEIPEAKRPVKPKTTARTKNPRSKIRKPPVVTEEKTLDPLASIRLVIEFKDGKKIERPMNEILRFSVDKGILTVISKDGTTSRHSILDVAKVTIE